MIKTMTCLVMKFNTNPIISFKCGAMLPMKGTSVPLDENLITTNLTDTVLLREEIIFIA